MTQSGHAKKLAEIQSLQKQLENTKKDMIIAKEEGDLRENFGYKQSKDDFGKLSRALEEKTLEIAGAEIINPFDWKNIDMDGIPRAMLGAFITIKRDQKEETFLLGGAGDDIPSVVPYNSPLGKALIPKREGAIINLEIGGKSEEIQIISCAVPSEAKLKEIYTTPKKETKGSLEKKKPSQKEHFIPPCME